MKLEMHDAEVGNTLSGRVTVNYTYQAEMYVQETAERKDLVRWELSDDSGLVCVWERPEGSLEIPSITQRSPRFEGEWEKGPNEVAIA